MRLSLIGLAAVISLLAACSHTPMHAEAPSVAPSPSTSKAIAGTSSGAQTGSLSQAQLDAQREAQRQEALKQQWAALNKAEVLFDFDDYTVKPDFNDMLIKQVEFMKSVGTDKLTLQGNSDERGGAEYNLALGQKRADAVRKALGLLGVPASRIETVSFGKEKPKASADCHEESCWAQNRRVDFVHASKP